MRTIVITILALVAGFFAGLWLSELIGIAGVLLLGTPMGIKYLPVILAVVFAGIALIVDWLLRHRTA